MSVFKFKHFSVKQSDSAMKVGTDAMILGAFIEASEKCQALDIGCGTGVLSLMIAQQNNSAQITAIDIDEASVQEAKLNFERSPWINRLTTIHNDFLSHDFEGQFDLIVSNPPYFSTTNENENKRKAQARHVSSLEIKPFIEKVNFLLRESGHFWLILPYSDSAQWFFQFEECGLTAARKIDIIGKEGNDPIRCVFELVKSSVITQNESFCIRNTDNSYSDEYKLITKEFHGIEI